jgi:hypothetical protein
MTEKDKIRAQGQDQAQDQKRMRGIETISIREHTKLVTRKYIRVKVKVDKLPPPRRARIELLLDDGTAVVVEGYLESAYVGTAYYKVYSRFIPIVEFVRDRIRGTKLLGETGQP